MGFISDLRALWDPETYGMLVSPRVDAEQRSQTEAFCAASTLISQTGCLIELFSGIFGRAPSGHTRRASWAGSRCSSRTQICARLSAGNQVDACSLDSVSLFAEAGIPAQHSLSREVTSRLFQHWLPPPREDTDTARLFAAIFPSSRAVQRFLDLDPAVFARLAAIFWCLQNLAAYPICTRTSMRRSACWRREFPPVAPAAPFASAATPRRWSNPLSYALVFATEQLIACEHAASAGNCMEAWLNAVFACRGEVALVRIHMEETGANSPLVFDLGAMDTALDRMELLAANLVEHPTEDWAAVRRLLNTLIRGLLEDTRISSLIQQNFNLLARKTVERTGHGGEHYIAHDRKEYFAMWRAAIGGGFLTVFTAAIKLHVVARHRAPFMEFILIGTNYAISFLLLQIFGLALATKQPAMTGATLANIINRNRGDSRRSQITEFSASISRTQLAAALGNILAVSLGAVVFNLVWLKDFHSPYVHAEQAQKVYLSLRPLASATAVDAALTGVLLWLAGLIGGWFENFAVYHRIPAAIAAHPLRLTLGDGTMQSFAAWVDRNIGPWSTSISLGYLLAFLPVFAEFFGLPLDVRHVTLNTGMFAFAAARFGPAAFAQVWLYSAIVGIAVMFVLNLGVSFAIASFVALRAYDVSHQERVVAPALRVQTNDFLA